MILQTVKKGSRNESYEESQIISCFSVEIAADMIMPDKAQTSDEELEIRHKNYVKAEELIREAGPCRDSIAWYLGDLPLEKNPSLTVVTLDSQSYIYSHIGNENTMVFILNDSGKTISRVI